MSKPFLARFDGVCIYCGIYITADRDMIVMTDDGALHEDCWKELSSAMGDPIDFSFDPKELGL